jgi:hypothetical protein
MSPRIDLPGVFAHDTSSRPGRAGGTRGTAMVEAVVALPVLTLLFVGVFFLRDVTTGKQEAQSLARTCVWLYSANNCESDGMPAECAGVLHEASAVLVGQDQSLQQRTGELTQSSDPKSPDVGGFAQGLLQAALDALFGKAAAADVSRSIPRPATFGGKTVSVAGHYRIACNVGETTLGQVAKDAWHSLM